MAFLALPPLAWTIGRFAGLDPESAFGAAEWTLLPAAAVLVLFCAGVLLTATPLEVDANAMRVYKGAWRLRWTRTIPLVDVAEITYVLA
jgi:hypothetical protein